MSEAMKAAVSLYNDPRFVSRSEVRIRNNKLRRKRIVTRQYLLLGLIISVLVFSIIFMATSFMADAQADTYKPEFKYYKTITVHTDDTMWSIAADNYSDEHYSSIGNYIEEICSINAIADINKLNAGEALIVPYYSSEYK